MVAIKYVSYIPQLFLFWRGRKFSEMCKDKPKHVDIGSFVYYISHRRFVLHNLRLYLTNRLFASITHAQNCPHMSCYFKRVIAVATGVMEGSYLAPIIKQHNACGIAWK